MTKWSDIQAFMRDNYKLQDDHPDMISMVWSYDDGRSQKVIVRRFEAAGREMVEFKSAFARKEDVEPLDMLIDNSKLPLATIALAGEVYLVVYNALLTSLQLDDVEFCLSRVAAVADTLEEKYANQDSF